MHITIYIRQVLTVLFFSCTTCIVYQYFKELAAFVLKAGAKVRTLFHIFQMFSEVFFSFCFFKGGIPERNKPQAEEIGKSSYAVPVRMSKHRCSRSRKRVQK